MSPSSSSSSSSSSESPGGAEEHDDELFLRAQSSDSGDQSQGSCSSAGEASDGGDGGNFDAALLAENVRDQEGEPLRGPTSSSDAKAMIGTGTSGLPPTIANVVNSILGSGVVGMPFALAQAGFAAGVLLFILLGYLTTFSVELIVERGSERMCDSYAATVELALGRVGFFLVPLFMFLFTYGAMSGYAIIAADVFPVAVVGLTGLEVDGSEDSSDEPKYPWFLQRELVILCFTLTIFLPLSLYRDVGKLGRFSMLAMVALVFVGSLVAYQAIVAGGFASVGAEDDNTSWWVAGRIFPAIGVLSNAYVCHHNSFLLFASMKPLRSGFSVPSELLLDSTDGSDGGGESSLEAVELDSDFSRSESGDDIRSTSSLDDEPKLWSGNGLRLAVAERRRRWRIATRGAVFIAFALLTTVGVCGFVTFRGSSKGNILLNLPDDAVTHAARLAMVMVVSLTYPLEAFVAREALETVLWALAATYRRRYGRSVLPAGLPAALQGEMAAHIALTLFVVTLCTVTAPSVRELGVVFELNGGLNAVALAYVLPACVGLRLDSRALLSWNTSPGEARRPWHLRVPFSKALSVVLLVLGIISMIASTIQVFVR